MKLMYLFRPIHRVSATVVLIAGALLVSLCAFAQTETAAVSGRVTDASGAVIVGAEVEIKNVDTNTSEIAKTNGEGFYFLPALPAGNYVMTVRKEAFRAVSVTGLSLSVQERLSRNFTLQVGSTVESITVRAESMNVNTVDGSVSTVVDQTYVANMPLNGRSFQDLILLTPGVVSETPQVAGTRGATGEFSVNGQRTEENYYTVDGVSANVGAAAGVSNGFNNTAGAGGSGSVAASTALGTTQALVSVDALQEFRVQSSTYSAEFGRNPGGQFAFETKSGTNQWHGSGYDYLRNGFFDAQDWFNDYLKTPTAALRQNDFGGTLGGPFTTPGIYSGKDKTFFFFSYEGLRLTAPQPASINVFVPDATMRASAPAALQPVMNAYPLPTPGGIDNPLDNTAQYISTWSNPSSIDSTSIRFDRVIGEKAKLFFRFSNTSSDSAARGLGFGNTPSINTLNGSTVRTYTAGFTSLPSNRLSNDLRLNYSSTNTTGASVIQPIGGSMPVDLLQLSGLNLGSDSTVCTFNIAFNPICLDQGRWSANQKQWNIVDTVGLTSGSHQFKFGIDYRRLAPNAVLATPDIGYDFFALSNVTSNTPTIITTVFNSAYPLYKNFSAFGEDEWRVSHRLSLSLGLRWELNPAPTVTRGLMPYTLRGSSNDTMALAPQGTRLWNTTWFNFAPRLGIAYLLHDSDSWETVLRVGSGVFFDTGNQNGSAGFSGPGFSALNFPSGTFPQTPSTPGVLGQINNPITKPPYGGVPFGFYPHLQLPYTIHWSASIEQALGKSQALTVSYVADHASRLLREDTIMPANNPNTGIFVLVQNGLTSDYNSLQLQFQRKLTKGLSALSSYTWSHCLDYGSFNNTFGYTRGNCAFDLRHNLSAAFSYELPNVGSGGLVTALLHHWGIDDRLTARTAFPITLHGSELFNPLDGKLYESGLSFTPGVASGQTQVHISGAQCATILQAALPAGEGCPGGVALNPNAFTTVDSGLGDAPRNIGGLFGAWQMDLAVRRQFPISERLNLQFRAEAFNIFNHPNFGMVDAQFGDTTFGLATATLAGSSGVLSPLYQQGGNRSMQFALKLVF